MRISKYFDFTYSTAPSGATGGSGAWSFTLPAGFTRYMFVAVGGGGGGVSGARVASFQSGYAYGGQGGGVSRHMGAISDLPSLTLSITVGAAGTGGTAPIVDQTRGNPGTRGGNTIVTSSGTDIVSARGGVGGQDASSGTDSEPGGVGTEGSSPGPAIGLTGPSLAGWGHFAGTGGYGTQSSGGTAGTYGSLGTKRAAGGTTPGSAGSAGGNGADNTSVYPFAGGGGGSAYRDPSTPYAGVGLAGGNGGLYGGGGGAGQTVFTGYTAGNGGNGAAGFVRIYLW